MWSPAGLSERPSPPASWYSHGSARAGSSSRSCATPSAPTLDRRYLDIAYAPMVELLGYLEANGFSNHIVSCSDADFWRPLTQELFGIPPERVTGTTTALEYRSDDHGGALIRKAALDFLDDGPRKPIHIWSRLGRRPLLAGGNSNGDIPMLDFTQHPDVSSLRLLVDHDDADREFAYTSDAERALKRAGTREWTVVSMRDDFRTMFATGDEQKAAQS